MTDPNGVANPYFTDPDGDVTICGLAAGPYTVSENASSVVVGLTVNKIALLRCRLSIRSLGRSWSTSAGHRIHKPGAATVRGRTTVTALSNSSQRQWLGTLILSHAG